MVKAINSSNIVHNIKTPVQKLLPAVSEVKPKKVTGYDILFFRQYLFAKGLEIKTTPDEIKKLFEQEGNDFFNASFEFLFKKLGIPQTLKPQIMEFPQSNQVGMAYDYANNLLLKNPNAPETTKLQTYSYIRHELQHLLQNLDIYRHKEYGEKAVKLYSDVLTKAQLKNIENIIKNVPMEELRAQGYPQEVLTAYEEVKNLLKENKLDDYKKAIEEIKDSLYEEHINSHENFRKLVLSELGTLKEGSRAERRAEKFFNGLSSSYFQDNGKIHWGKYNFDIRETEALIAQDVAESDVQQHLGEKNCYIKRVKNQIKNMIENKEQNKEQIEQIDETAQDFCKKHSITSAKEYADYLFD